MRFRVLTVLILLGLIPATARGQGVLVGEVFDSTTASPLVGAQITVLGPGMRTRTDTRGAYRLDVPAGVHTLLLAHPRLESLPIPIPLRDVHVADGETRRVDFHLPSMATILGRACGPGATGVLVGRVRDELVDQGLGQARVRVRSLDRSLDRRTHTATTDANGIYRFCDLPTGAELSVAADFHGQGMHAVSVSLPRDRAVLLDFDLAVTGPSRIMGRVVDARSQTPVPHVAVTVDGTGQTRITDEDGRFLVPELAPGIYGLQTTHIAYTGQTDSVVVGGNEVVELEIRLEADVLRLPPVVVLSRSRPLISAGHMSTFESRRKTGSGYYITREDIERVAPFSITGLLRRVPGLRVVPNGHGTYAVYMARQPLRLNILPDSTRRGSAPTSDSPPESPATPQLGGRMDPSPGACQVQFFVDGGPVRLAEDESIDRLVSVHSVQGVEVYRGASEIPLGIFSSDARCGAVVIWTRHGE